MKRALKEYRIEPIKTTIPVCLEILNNNLYCENKVDTSFIEKHIG
jgi:biotin carboxylase